ncbi:MAG: hypothetical protein QME49_00385 [bacterium]|nr:hypothetical protein [bacterium]
MCIQNKTEAGMSLVELMIAGLLLLIVALTTATIFLNSSQTIVKSWDESVAVARAQELLEEVKGIKYEYIHQATSTSTQMDHYHLSVVNPVIMPQGQKSVDVQVRVIAHTNDDYIAAGYNLGSLTITWEHEGISTIVGNISGGFGINTATITLTTKDIVTQRSFGILSINNGTSPQRLMIFPSQGENIKDKDMIGTITMNASFIDDSSDGVGAGDMLPDDYKQITVTVACGKPGGKTSSRQLVTIIAPKPTSYYK